MELALYHPRLGYYARAVQRSGRSGDFFTSVDVGSIFGELLAIQIAEMAERLNAPDRGQPFDLVEVGAGNGRLTADVLRALRSGGRALYDRTRAHLVERSVLARAAQPVVLADVADRVVTSSDVAPQSFEGVVFANELLDAMPVHQVIMRPKGLREVYVESDGTRLRTIDGPLSTPRLESYFADLGIVIEPGWRAEVNLHALDWIGDIAHRLACGFVVLIDYGHQADELYSAGHAGGTLTASSRHTSAGPESSGDAPRWLARPGEVDLTAHVDFTSVARAGQAAGLTSIALLDQTYFLMGLAEASHLTVSATSECAPHDAFKRRLALKTLLLPGGLGSTFKVLILAKGVMNDAAAPPLKGCSYRVRVT